MWVGNREVEINRPVDCDRWRYAESSNMISDLGTCKGALLTDIGLDSQWIRRLCKMLLVQYVNIKLNVYACRHKYN